MKVIEIAEVSRPATAKADLVTGKHTTTTQKTWEMNLSEGTAKNPKTVQIPTPNGMEILADRVLVKN